ncbi:hypothetical protein ACFOY2_23090 [Nonomuraea purpurea]|uniref:Uncharacterized protein n=1 Tax=Nonomuraea purpurea TaxID=1849276 RepID=A0ABV8GBT7_9ACTN
MVALVSLLAALDPVGELVARAFKQAAGQGVARSAGGAAWQ